MKKISITNQFKRDLRRLKKRGKNLLKLDNLVQDLIQNRQLDSKYREHKLIGNYLNKLESHIEPDWLLIYEISDLHVTLLRTGTHNDLFD